MKISMPLFIMLFKIVALTVFLPAGSEASELYSGNNGYFKGSEGVFHSFSEDGVNQAQGAAENNSEHQQHRGSSGSNDTETVMRPAFPGAMGPGSTTMGGRGGTIYKVTRLDDYQAGEDPVPGTLRYALEKEGPRIVTFAVGGTLRLLRPLVVTEPYLTVAGNTAPFPGITVFGYPTTIRADHVILRYLRFRLDVEVMRERFAAGLDSGWDSVNAGRCEFVVFDHISASHSVDETISFSGHVDQVILSNSISAYSLRSIFHDYYFTRGPDYRHAQTHNLGGLIAYMGSPDRNAEAGSYYNIWAHHDRRMPGLSAGRDEPENLVSHIDIRYSVMYNWKSNAAGIETGSAGRSNYHVNLIGNYFKPGPNTPEERWRAGLTVMGLNRVYLQNNVHDDDARAGRLTDQPSLLLDRGRMPAGHKRILEQPLPVGNLSGPAVLSLAELANRSVGASIPARDDIDHLVIQDIYNGTGYHPFVDMQTDESPVIHPLPEVVHVYASHEDPFPIWWKRMHGYSDDQWIPPHEIWNGNGYYEQGYTNIEAYLHGFTREDGGVNTLYLEPGTDGFETGSDAARMESRTVKSPLKTEEGTFHPAVHTNPLARFESNHYHMKQLFSRQSSPPGWINHENSETICSAEDGMVIMTSSSALEPGRMPGCRWLRQDGPEYWSAGRRGIRLLGPPGALNDDGAALVFAFPLPQKVSGITLSKPYPEAYSGSHDPARVKIQGLLGWPQYWVDLTSEIGLPGFSDEQKSFDILIPENRRSHYAAYRIILLPREGEEDLRLQSVFLLSGDPPMMR